MVVAAGPIEIRTTSDCPSAADLIAQLRPLMPALRAATGVEDVATVEVLETGAEGATAIHLRLVRDGAIVVGDRRLFLRESCTARAETIATVIAAWETTQPLEADAGREAPAAQGGVVSRAATKTAPWQARIGLGLGAAWVGGTTTAGVAEAQLGPARSHWQLRLGFAAQRGRTRALPPGQVEWQHTGGSAGVVLRSLSPSWPLAIDVGACAGWATLQGQGYPAGNLQQRSFEYGLVAGGRAGRIVGRWTLWAEIRANAWTHSQRALLAGSLEQHDDLRPFDVTTSAGISVSLFD